MNFNISKEYKRFRILIKPLLGLRTLAFFLVGPYGQTALFSPLFGSINLAHFQGFESRSFSGHTKTIFQKIFDAVRGLYSPFHKRVNIFGTGYKAYVPKIFKRTALIFRVGFGGAEIGSKLNSFVKGRARKQRIILVSPFQDKVMNDFSVILGLKRPDPYKAKGIRNPLLSYSLKPGKVRTNR